MQGNRVCPNQVEMNWRTRLIQVFSTWAIRLWQHSTFLIYIVFRFLDVLCSECITRIDFKSAEEFNQCLLGMICLLHCLSTTYMLFCRGRSDAFHCNFVTYIVWIFT